METLFLLSLMVWAIHCDSFYEAAVFSSLQQDGMNWICNNIVNKKKK